MSTLWIVYLGVFSDTIWLSHVKLYKWNQGIALGSIL